MRAVREFPEAMRGRAAPAGMHMASGSSPTSPVAIFRFE
jgi:hypothetical protein